MAQFKRGSFVVGPAAGSVPITGVGFTPDVVIFLSAQHTAADGTVLDGYHGVIGWECRVANPAGLTPVVSIGHLGFAQYVGCRDALPSSDTGRRAAQNGGLVFGTLADPAVEDSRGSVSSFDADGFTITWPNPLDGAWVIEYLAIEGVQTATGQSTMGALDPFVVSGMGFQPDALLCMGPFSNSATAELRVGMATAPTERGAFSWRENNAATTTSIQHAGGSSRVFVGTNATPIFTSEYDLASFDAGGFTLDALVAAGSLIWLALKGVNAKVVEVVGPGAIGQQQITGVGFSPDAVFAMSQWAPARGGTTLINTLDMRPTFGMAADGSGQACVAGFSQDNVPDSNTTRNHFQDRLIDHTGGAAPVTIDSYDADGLTLGWSVAGSQQILMLVLGSTTGAPPPTEITGLGGIASSAAAGTPTVATRNEITGLGGIGSSALVGTPALETRVEVTGLGSIASSAAVGSPSVSVVVSLTGLGGIASSAVVGTPTLTTRVDVAGLGGIPSSAAVGTPGVEPGLVEVGLGGIPSSAVVGTPTIVLGPAPQLVSGLGGISSSAAGGTPTLSASYTLSGLGGVPSSAAVGSPALESSYALTGLGGIASSATVGTPVLEPGVVTLALLGGIASSAAVGIPGLSAFIIYRRGVLPTGGIVERAGVLTGGSSRLHMTSGRVLSYRMTAGQAERAGVRTGGGALDHTTGGEVSIIMTGGASRLHKTGGDPETLKTGGVVR